MSDRSIVTQSQLGDLKVALAQEGDALSFHATDSLSKSHGFNLVNSGYQDSAGNDVGTAQLKVIVNNTYYYAPMVTTALAGQNPTAGVVPDQSRLLQPGRNSWVTDYASQPIEDANLVLSGLLLPHTRQAYWESHMGVHVWNTAVLDSAGHTVGDHVLEVFFNQRKIWIPCSNRLGGPVQGPRLTVPCPALIDFIGNFGGTELLVCPCYMRWESPAGGGPADDGKFTLRWSGIQGTFPMTYQLQYSGDATNWLNWSTASVHVSSGVGIAATTATSGTIASGTFDFTGVGDTAGGDNGGMIYFRVTFSNAAGSISTCPVAFWIQDNAPCCWFCTEANKHQRISPENWRLIGRVEQAVFKLDRRALTSYVKHGDRLVAKMLEHGVAPQHFIEFTEKVISMALHGQYEEAARFYINFVADDINAHWPEVTLRGWLRYLKVAAPPKPG